MKTEMWPLERIKPYAHNPRVNEHAVAAVMESIHRFGFRQPIVVDEAGVIVCGDTRRKAAERLGLTEAPVHVAQDLTPEQIRAYRIADNKTAELADWDLKLLPLELAELQSAGIDWTLLGFDADELLKLLGGEVKAGLCDPDEIPAPPDEAVTRPGDLWILGEHRLLCGDSSKSEDVDRLLAIQPCPEPGTAGEVRCFAQPDGALACTSLLPIHLVNTDPPYNVNVNPRSNNAIASGASSFWASDAATQKITQTRAKDRAIANDHMSEEEFGRCLRAWFGQMARVLLPGRAFYLWGGYANIRNYPHALADCGMYFSQQIIWHKSPVLNRKDFMGAHEWCFYGWREGAAHVFFGPANVPDVWDVKKLHHSEMVHLTEKPVELAVRALQYSSRPGEHVLDLFGGSGSTLIAAEQTERRAFLVELDPLYCDVIVQRWEKFTGQKAERLAT